LDPPDRHHVRIGYVQSEFYRRNVIPWTSFLTAFVNLFSIPPSIQLLVGVVLTTHFSTSKWIIIVNSFVWSWFCVDNLRRMHVWIWDYVGKLDEEKKVDENRNKAQLGFLLNFNSNSVLLLHPFFFLLLFVLI